MRELCAIVALFTISDLCVNYVVLTWYVCRICDIKVIHLWYMHERSVKLMWTYVDICWTVMESQKMWFRKNYTQLCKIYLRIAYQLCQIRINCEISKNQKFWSAQNRIPVKTHLPKPSADICTHQWMKNAWNTYELSLLRMYHEWQNFHTWNMHKLYVVAVWHSHDLFVRD